MTTMSDLANIRHANADHHFDSFDFAGFTVADYDGWKYQIGTDSMTRVVYFENGNEFSDVRAHQTVKAIFAVRFFPFSAKILDSTCTIDGNEISQPYAVHG